MRKILFRGMDVMTGDWVIGSYVKTAMGLHYILPQNLIANSIPQTQVDKTTVGEYTGLTDKNKKMIFEGDIYHQGDPNITYTVVWHDSGLIGKQNGSSSYAGLSHWQDRIEVIGNIYENPES